MATMTPYSRGLLALPEDQPRGILSGVGQGGILSGIRDLRSREPGRRPVLDFLGNRSAALTGMGLALLTARTQRQAFEGLQNALNSGRQVDYARGRDRREEASQARKEQALATVLQHYGLDSGLSALPEVAQAAIVQAMKPPEDTRTDDMQEFDYARENGFTGSFGDWMRIRSPQTTIDARNMGNIPPGYRIEYDPAGNPVQMVPIPGSPAAREAATEEQAAAARQEQRTRSADIVVQDIDRVLGALEGPNQATAPGLFVTGPVGNVLSGIPGTPAADVARTLDTIKANVGFDRLQQMRDASPTGGALGQVSQQENILLQSVLGSLAQSQTYEQFQYNLKRLKNVYLDIVHGPGQGPPREALAGESQPSGPVRLDPNNADAEYEALTPGTEFIGPDGVLRRKP